MSPLDPLFQSLEEHGWAVSDSLIPVDWQQTLLQMGQQLWHEGRFHPAHIGRQANTLLHPDIRGDSICWIDAHSPPGHHPFFDWLAQFRQALNARYYLGLRRHECHFARYEPGRGYARHIDQHRGTVYRKISVVLYLNPQWRQEDGGELCVYENDDGNAHRVSPTPGRLAVFRSDSIPHEVLPARQTRWSLTGWLRTDDE